MVNALKGIEIQPKRKLRTVMSNTENQNTSRTQPNSQNAQNSNGYALMVRNINNVRHRYQIRQESKKKKFGSLK